MAYCTWCGSNQMESGVNPYYCSPQCEEEADQFHAALEADVEKRKNNSSIVAATATKEEL